jgi:hypothetical protein
MHAFWREDVFPAKFKSKREHVNNIFVGISLMESMLIALIFVVMQLCGFCNIWKMFYFKTYIHFLIIQSFVLLALYLFHYFFYLKSGRYKTIMSEYKEELEMKGVDISKMLYSLKYQSLFWFFILVTFLFLIFVILLAIIL